MKETVYFTSDVQTWTEVQSAIKNAVEKRDEFLEENKSKIGKIDNEDVKFITLPAPQQIFAVIKLSYYLK